MAEYIGVSYRTYQRRAKKGMLDTVKGYERVKNKLVQIEYGTF